MLYANCGAGAVVTVRGYWGENEHVFRLIPSHIVDVVYCFYLALFSVFSVLEQTHCAHMWFYVLLKTTNYSRNGDSGVKTHHDQHRRRRGDRKISNGKGSLRHWHLLQSQRTLNLKLTRLLSRDMQSVLSVRRHARCIVGKTRDLRDLKIHRSQYLFFIDDSSMWTQSRTYGFLSKSGFGAIRL